MFLVDDLLMSPVKGVLWVFKEIHNAAQQELAGESDTITAALSELYMELDTGQITEEEFSAQEKALLDRLDRLQAQKEPAAVEKPLKRRPKTKRSGKRLPVPESLPAVL
jgi:hypothetical protein